MEKDRVIHSFRKNPDEEVRLAIREYKDRRYLDVRLWYRPETGSAYLPTKKGITLGLEFVPELKRGLERASRESTEGAGQSSLSSVE